MTTALAIYDPDLLDAGRGLRFSGPWLVSTPSATRVRWMAPWLQIVISEGWNVSLLTARWLRPRLARAVRWVIVSRRLKYVALPAAALVIVAIVVVQPLAMLVVGGPMGAALGFLFIGGMGPREVAR